MFPSPNHQNESWEFDSKVALTLVQFPLALKLSSR